MALKKLKPMTPGTRGMSILVAEEVNKNAGLG